MGAQVLTTIHASLLAVCLQGVGTAPAELAKLNSDFTALTNSSSKHPWPSTTVPPNEVTPFLNDTTTMMVKFSSVKFP
jgi:hypothetical protein